jgi:hypothetical protein
VGCRGVGGSTCVSLTPTSTRPASRRPRRVTDCASCMLFCVVCSLGTTGPFIFKELSLRVPAGSRCVGACVPTPCNCCPGSRRGSVSGPRRRPVCVPTRSPPLHCTCSFMRCWYVQLLATTARARRPCCGSSAASTCGCGHLEGCAGVWGGGGGGFAHCSLTASASFCCRSCPCFFVPSHCSSDAAFAAVDPAAPSHRHPDGSVKVLGKSSFHDTSLNAERIYMGSDWGRRTVAFSGYRYE